MASHDLNNARLIVLPGFAATAIADQGAVDVDFCFLGKGTTTRFGSNGVSVPRHGRDIVRVDAHYTTR